MNVAFIPARGGSQSIHLKNIMMLNGHPLIYWTVKAASDSKYIDEVVVSTDSLEIRKTVESLNINKVRVINRSPETASNTATTESAMLEFAGNYLNFESIMLIQATSPLLTTHEIDEGFELYYEGHYDSVISGVRKKQFLWNFSEDGIEPTYDPLNRPRRQDYNGYIVENGAFYITKRELLLNSECRISGKIGVYEMNENSIFEIDEPDDWVVIEAIMQNRRTMN